jgi:AraC family transcriptional regulator
LLVQRCIFAQTMENERVHGTPDVRLVLAESGRTTSVAQVGGRRSSYDWRPGQLTLMAPGQYIVCSYRASEPPRTLQVDIPAVSFERTAEQLSRRAVDYEGMAASIGVGDSFLREAMRTVADTDGGGDLYAESAAAFLSVHLLTHHSGRSVHTLPTRADARIRSIVSVMRERMAEPLTLTDLAGEAYLTVYHFVRVFKAATGDTPHRFLTRMRLEEAGRLLRTGDLSIAAIASRCGFASPGALSAAFLKHAGMRPSAYRESRHRRE